MRVSLVTREFPPQIYGGAGVHVTQLASHLAELVDLDIQCLGLPRPGATAHAEDFPSGANPALRVFGADLSIVAGMPAVDLVHSHTWYANLAGHLASIYQSVPHVITAHSLEPLRPWKRDQLGGGYDLSCWAERTAFMNASAIIAVSQAMADDITSVYPDINPAIISTIRNGVDGQAFYPDQATDFPATIGLDVDRPSLVYVGRIAEQKGLLHLLRAARHFPTGTQIVLLASSPDTPEIAAQFQQELEKLQTERGSDVIWVKEMAPRQGLRQVLSQATVFACPSIYEPLCIVNLEAMACQTAVVATTVGGIPEVVQDQVTGTLVDYDPAQAGDPAYLVNFENRFAEAVNSLLASPSQAHRYGLAGRQRCLTDFNWATIAEETVAVYQRGRFQFVTSHQRS